MDNMQQPPTNQEPFAVEPPKATSAPSDNDRLLAGLSYVSQIVIPAVFPVILLVSNETKNSPFMRFHAIQSLGVLVASIVYYLAATVVYALVSAVLPLLACILWLLFFVPAVAGLYCGYEAFRGKYLELPWLTQFMRDNHWL
jgi:uncharacterized membrane protein